jgi:hypothetical protein
VQRPILVLLALVSTGTAAHACADLATAPRSRWSVASKGGVSWLLTPCGAPFFSIGVNALNEGGRPEDGGARIPYHWRTAYPDFAAWLVSTRGRVAAWGFNTASATSLPPELLELPTIPDLELGRSARFHWADPFDPATETRMRETARRLVRPYKGNPYRIGYFPDNEVGWWSGALFAFYLEKDDANHTKRRLVALLRDHYRDDWGRFARDFISPPGVSSFAALRRKPATCYLRPGGAGIRVVRRWTALVAERYYRLVRRVLHEADPDALLFSDRLPIYYDPAAVRAMAPYVDAVATNYNVDSPDGWIARYYFDGLRQLTGGKPVLISEWFFAARENRSGNRNNGHLMAVATQVERARGAAEAAERFAREPTIVGAHWFQYYDHPRGGRDDGEDYNFGLVDIADRPYEPLVSAFTRVNPALAALHGERPPPPTGRAEIPPAAIDAGDRSLAEWPKERALLRHVPAAPGDVPFADLYLAWDRDGLSLAVIGMDYYAPEILPRDRALAREDAFHIDWGVDAGRGPRRLALFVVPPPIRSGRADYVMQATLCRRDGDECAAVPGAVATYFGADQPRITAEAHVPWSALGLDGPPAGPLRTALAVTGFHHGRWMSTSGRPPRETMDETTRWRAFPLARE